MVGVGGVRKDCERGLPFTVLAVGRAKRRSCLHVRAVCWPRPKGFGDGLGVLFLEKEKALSMVLGGGVIKMNYYVDHGANFSGLWE